MRRQAGEEGLDSCMSMLKRRRPNLMHSHLPLVYPSMIFPRPPPSSVFCQLSVSDEEGKKEIG